MDFKLLRDAIVSAEPGDLGFPVAQMVKNPPVMQETWVRSLGWENSLERGTATHSNILAWRIPWTKEPGTLQSMGSQRAGHNRATFTTLTTGYL